MLFNISAEVPVPGQEARDGHQAIGSNGWRPHPAVEAQWSPAYGEVSTGVCVCGYSLAAGFRFCQNCGRQVLAAPALAAPAMDSRGAPAKAGFPAWGIASIICSLIALVLVPALFGGLGILFGFFAWRENKGVGSALMIAGGVSIVAGIAIAIAAMEAGAY